MRSAYGAAARMVDAKTTDEERTLLEDINADDIVVVEGIYDRVQDVLSIMDLPFKVIAPSDVSSLQLKPEQMIVVNCPGVLDSRSIVAVREFVNSGGTLFTTDWALRHVLERAFKGIVRFNGTQTGDSVVQISNASGGNPMLEGIDLVGGEAQWWLEGASYPIKVLDAEKVEVLVDSHELGRNWGESPVVVTFPYGKGEVLHMISHYYLQRTELRSRRHKKSWKDYAAEMGTPDAVVGAPPEYDSVNVGQVESAYSSAMFLRNSVLRRKKRTADRLKNKLEGQDTETKI